MPDSAIDCKPYLDYLVQEMNLLGILATFCVAAASLVFDRVVSADKDSFLRPVWDQYKGATALGSANLIAATYWFNKQRSDLAFYYGRICMSIARPTEEFGLDNWLREVESWDTWRAYRIGWAALALAVIVYAHLFYRLACPMAPSLYWLAWLCAVIVVLRTSVMLFVFNVYRYEDRPFKGFNFRKFFNDWKHRGEQ